ncbi:hypothetical protein AGDE_11507 [Angomonas deanei]|uniref:Protein kinase domain/Protein tyrosine kinase, putative n=1 Tax=Angomonas deanei TaxID=59799 RepID=A0A7G2CEQ8_9TRYP|nr:hypothetical protein AGDE_11507 [Angomonas deanei]CAD2218246.1 Protein kinase domain/Protein tyrosine kinase, putative [Angomonas deanei]|eukprot:EPY26167.1 hypothetical protein AGDE_11507 [Angomonas deanei]
MSYSSLTSDSDSSTGSDCTSISESVPSCSLTAMDAKMTGGAGRLRKPPPPQAKSNSFGSIFGGAEIDPFDGRSISHHTDSSVKAVSDNSQKDSYNATQMTGIRPDDVFSNYTFSSGLNDKSDNLRDDPPNGSNSGFTNQFNGDSSYNTSYRPSVLLSKKASTDDGQWQVTRVEKLARIGRGSYGDVYKGKDLDTGNIIAIKEILVSKDFTKDIEKQLDTLEREIIVMRKLHHPSIINYLGASRDENCLQIFMEYIGGGSIGDALKADGPFPEDRARGYTKQLLNGLLYLHERKILHRDLKGDNLFLTEDGILKVGDFGTSKELVTTLVTDSVAGTPNFMAPEVIACSGHGYAADIWSVGCCVLEMLIGSPPFSKMDNHMAVMFAIMKGKFDSEIPDNISEPAKSFIRACTMFAVEDRWTASQLMEHPWLVGEAAGNSKQRQKSIVGLGEVVSPSAPTRDMQRRRSVAQAFRSSNNMEDSTITALNAAVSMKKKTTTGDDVNVSKSRSESPPASSPDKSHKAKSLDVTALQSACNGGTDEVCGTTSSNGEETPRHTSPRQPKATKKVKSESGPRDVSATSDSKVAAKLRPHPPDSASPKGNPKRGASGGPHSTTATRPSKRRANDAAPMTTRGNGSTPSIHPLRGASGKKARS